jgi:hypothetical protein
VKEGRSEILPFPCRFRKQAKQESMPSTSSSRVEGRKPPTDGPKPVADEHCLTVRRLLGSCFAAVRQGHSRDVVCVAMAAFSASLPWTRPPASLGSCQLRQIPALERSQPYGHCVHRARRSGVRIGAHGHTLQAGRSVSLRRFAAPSHSLRPPFMTPSSVPAAAAIECR